MTAKSIVFYRVYFGIKQRGCCNIQVIHRQCSGLLVVFIQFVRRCTVKKMNVSEWLTWVKSLNVKQIDLSLERVTAVWGRLSPLKPEAVVITVAGTNGKGSTVAGLEAIYLAEGYRVGAFTSPYLFQFNEQIRIQGQSVSDDILSEAFLTVFSACGDIQLTPFEFATLAALVIFKQSHLDVWILEVGLGGRFDAVNAVDADVAVVTSIGIDHTDWLGETRAAIAYEKAGIFRANRPAVCGDFNPPSTLIDYAEKLKAPLYCQGQQFHYVKQVSSWTWQSDFRSFEHLPLPILALQNMSTVLMAISLLQNRLPVSDKAINATFATVTLAGRIQVIPGEVSYILDVSHNPAAVELLAEYLRKESISGKTHAVFSMLADKDIVATIQVIDEWIDHWYVAPLNCDRGASKEVLAYCFRKTKIDHMNLFDSIALADHAAKSKASPGDRIIVFGSFHTVSGVGINPNVCATL